MKLAFLVPTYDQENLLLAQLDILSFCPVQHEVIVLYSGDKDLPVPHVRYPSTKHGPSGAALAFVYGLREAKKRGVEAVCFRNGDDWMFNHDLVRSRVQLLESRPIVGYSWFSDAGRDDLTLNELYVRLDKISVDLDQWEHRIIEQQPHDPERHVAAMLNVSEEKLHRLGDREDPQGIGRSHHEDKEWRGPFDPDNNRWFNRQWQLIASHDDKQRRAFYQDLRPVIPYAAELEKRPHFMKWLQAEPARQKVSVRFYHGLGDCANFAHTLPLWQRRGFDFEINCATDKAPVFVAAGAKIVKSGKLNHGWPHPPSPPAGYRPSPSDGYAKNKAAWNITHGGMPAIGHYSELWKEFCGVRLSLEPQITPEIRASVRSFLDKLERPIVLLALKGNTGSNMKNYPDDKTRQLYGDILDRVGGTCLVLDWDNRVPIIDDPQVRHVQRHWKNHLSLLELWQTISDSDLLISIDSGPLHFARFTDTPVIGVWTRHYPSHFVLPSTRSVHLVPDRHGEWNRAGKDEFNLVECSGNEPSPAAIAEQVEKMVCQNDSTPPS